MPSESAMQVLDEVQSHLGDRVSLFLALMDQIADASDP
jgi:hypothetical protein